QGPRSPTTWCVDAPMFTCRLLGPLRLLNRILTHGHDIPQGAIIGGQQNGQTIYICRAYYEGGIRKSIFFVDNLI
ncbi:MAG TPA: hypothetical protein VGO47_00415, partial [Chlamydiales bacterium]|nr:hypothetical protein [Chlamydiales bacterium]